MATAAADSAADVKPPYNGPEKVKATTKDGKEFELDMTYMYLCQMLKMTFEGMDSAPDSFSLPINLRCLEKVKQFCEYHAKNPKERSVLDERFVIDHFKEFDKKFSLEMREDVDLLYETIAAADYLNQSYLLDVLCRTAAILIKNKPVEKVREILSIPVVSDDEHKANNEKHPFIKKYH